MKNIQKLLIFFIGAACLMIGGLINNYQAKAAVFDPNYLLADSELAAILKRVMQVEISRRRQRENGKVQ